METVVGGKKKISIRRTRRSLLPGRRLSGARAPSSVRSLFWTRFIFLRQRGLLSRAIHASVGDYPTRVFDTVPSLLLRQQRE